jgi:hypothetical protein
MDILEQGRNLQKLLLQAAETASRLNREASGRLNKLASLTAQAAEEAEVSFTSQSHN